MAASMVNVVHKRWLQLFVVGLALFFATEQAMAFTGNPNFAPTVMLLGAFLIPITFVAYFYEHIKDRDISLPLLTTCFFVGGLIGLITAGTLEYATLRSMSVPTLFGIGLIEETAKLIFPVALYIMWKYRHQADGLLFGVAAGMGFAALETMGYSLVTLIQSQGNVRSLMEVMLVRGLVSPAGHAAWTGFVCAVLWREREQAGGRITINLKVIGAFVLAVVLHALWNMFSGLSMTAAGVITPYTIVLGLLVIISLTIVISRYLAAKKTLGDPKPKPVCAPPPMTQSPLKPSNT